MRAPLLAAMAVGALALAAHPPAVAQAAAAQPVAPQPLRLSTGAELWTIPDAALQQFVSSGTFSDQRLLRLATRSGWPDDALRAALQKPYAVDVGALSRFLDSPPGVTFLQQQTRAYRPLQDRPGGPDLRVVALRAAILSEARGGTLTALGILRRLPVPLVIDLAGPSPLRCSSLPCDDPQQCSSVFSWIVFLPACLQAAGGGAR